MLSNPRLQRRKLIGRDLKSAERTRPCRLGQLDRGGFWSLSTIGYADKDALALVQTHDARPLKRGGVYEDILPAAVQNDEAEPLGGVVPLHRPHLLDARLQGLSA